VKARVIKVSRVAPIALVLAATAPLTGCGSDRASPTVRSTASASRPAIYTTDQSARAAVASAVAECKRGVASASGVIARTKQELENACNEGFQRLEPTEVHIVTKSVCKELAYVSSASGATAKARVYSQCYAIATR
jgi:hypothetical protein